MVKRWNENYVVTIAHAVADENGKGYNGKAGDQNGKEVRLQAWYKSGDRWDYVLRCRNEHYRNMIADNAIWGARNPHLGYDMYQRYTAWNAVKDKGFNLSLLDKDAECDCSQLATMCCRYAGIPIPKETYTRNMLENYTAVNRFAIHPGIGYCCYPSKLVVGDILLREGHHTAIVVNTIYWLKTSLNQSNATTDRVKDVKAVQARLDVLYKYQKGWTELKVDGKFGPKTKAAVEKFQTDKGLQVDGSVGKITAKELGFLYGE